MFARPAGLLVAALLAGAHPSMARADRPWVFGSIAPEGSVYADGSEGVARALEGEIQGLRIKRRFGGVLGDELSTVRMVQQGRIELFTGSLGALVDLVPELRVLELPYLFANETEVDSTIEKMWPQMRKALAARGYEGVGWSAVGFRHLWTKRPIGSLDDLRKLRIRSMPTPTYERFWKLAGVSAVAMGVPEVAPLLEQGSLDGFDQAITFTFASSWHQYVKHLTLTAHIFQPGVAVIGPQGRSRIPKSALPTLTVGVDLITKESLHRVREVDRGLLSSLPGVGVAVVPAPAGLVNDLKVHAGTVRTEWRKTATPAGKKLYDAIQKLLAAARG